MEWMWIVGALVASYLVGSLSFAVILSRVFGLADPRSYGSGNPGATNVLRSGNRKAAVLTLVFDALKGFVPVVLCLAFGERVGLSAEVAAWVGLAAFVGHLWPVFFGFKGGKGVATTLGTLLAADLPVGLATCATWLIVAFAFRYSSLAALLSTAAAPVLAWYLPLLWAPGAETVGDARMAGFAAFLAVLVWAKHHANIRRLLAGTEPKIGKSKKNQDGVG